MTSWWMKLYRTKRLEGDVMKTELKRCLTTFDLVLIGIGSMVGSGMYVLTGEIAHSITGPAIVLSFFIAGITSGLSAWCYAEFGTRVPRAGSAYIYTYLTIGELAAFVIGWNLVLEHVIGAAAIVRGLLGYINEITNDRVEESIPKALGDSGFNPYTTIFVVFMCILVCIGIKESVFVNNFLTTVNISVALFVIIFGFYLANWANWTHPDGFFPYGPDSILEGAAQAYFAFVGYENIAIASEEAITPAFSIPFALAFDVIFVGVLYCSISAALTSMVPYTEIDEDAAFARAFDYQGWEWAKYVVSVGAIAAMCCTLLGAIVTMPRCIYAMATDGLLFHFLARINPTTQVPVIATIIGSIFIAVFAFFLTLGELAEFMSIGTLLAYLIIAVAVIVLRYSPMDLIGGEVAESSSSEKETEPLTNQDSVLKPNQIYAISFFIILVIVVNILIAIAETSSSSNALPYILSVIGILSVVMVLSLAYLSAISKENNFGQACRIPLVPFLPGLSIFCNFHLMTRLNYWTWVRFIGWMAVGLLIYFLYGVSHSTAGAPGAGERAGKNTSGDYGATEDQEKPGKSD